MGEGGSGTRWCGRCGYVFGPFETECPRCARVGAVAPAASGPAAATVDSGGEDAAGYGGMRPMAVVLMVALAMGLLLIALIAFAVPAHEQETTRGGSWIVVVLPLLMVLGYAVGNPGLWEGGRSCLAVILAVWAGLFVLASLGESLIRAAIYGGSGFAVVMPPLIATVSMEASALLSCLLHDQLDRKLYRRIGLTLAILLWCIMSALWALAVSRLPQQHPSSQDANGQLPEVASAGGPTAPMVGTGPP